MSMNLFAYDVTLSEGEHGTFRKEVFLTSVRYTCPCGRVFNLDLDEAPDVLAKRFVHSTPGITQMRTEIKIEQDPYTGLLKVVKLPEVFQPALEEEKATERAEIERAEIERAKRELPSAELPSETPSTEVVPQSLPQSASQSVTPRPLTPVELHDAVLRVYPPKPPETLLEALKWAKEAHTPQEHALVAEWLLDKVGDCPEEYPEIIAMAQVHATLANRG